MEFLAWLEQTDGSVWLRESDWGHPIILCFHAVGMGMVVGISLMYSARILGYARDFPLSAFDRLFGLAWSGGARTRSRACPTSARKEGSKSAIADFDCARLEGRPQARSYPLPSFETAARRARPPQDEVR